MLKLHDAIIYLITWLFLPIFIDYERITRKSRTITGYIKSIVFYHDCYLNTVKKQGFLKAIILYTLN